MNEKLIIFFTGIVVGYITTSFVLCIINRINPLYLLLDRLTAFVLWTTGVLGGVKKCEGCDKNRKRNAFCTDEEWKNICLECRDSWELLRPQRIERAIERLKKRFQQEQNLKVKK